MVKSSMNNANLTVFAVAVAAAASMVLQTTEAAEYVVGDDLGWTVPPNGAATYVEWASKYNFLVNDILGNNINQFSPFTFLFIYFFHLSNLIT